MRMSWTRSRWTWLAAAALGLLAGVAALPWWQRERAIRGLFSAEASDRAAARAWLDAREDEGGSTRLAGDAGAVERIVARLPNVADDAAFLDAVGSLREAGRWRLEEIPVEAWRRRLALTLDAASIKGGDDAVASVVIDELLRLPLGDGRALEVATPLWLRLVEWPGGLAVREWSLLRGSGWLGSQRGEPLIVAALDDSAPEVRRLAWLLLGHVNPAAGYSANLQAEPPEVVEAVLWAATVTNPDDASVLLESLSASPWPTPALPWLLSRSDDEGAKAALAGLITDGHPSAPLHWAERFDGDGRARPLPPHHAAWLGLESDEQAERPGTSLDADAMLQSRWRAWRAGAGPASLLADPVAEDGSTWVAVLLAERILSRQNAEAFAAEWSRALDPEVVRAGWLLQLLTSDADKSQTVSDPNATSGESTPAHQSKFDRASTWRVWAANPDSGEGMDALFALLINGDARAMDAMLGLVSDPTASVRGEPPTPAERLIEFGWFIERFAPALYEATAPLSPWQSRVAALQWDVLRTGWALHGPLARFDPMSRTFVYAASSAAPTVSGSDR